jgi:hypothetical protein
MQPGPEWGLNHVEDNMKNTMKTLMAGLVALIGLTVSTQAAELPQLLSLSLFDNTLSNETVTATSIIPIEAQAGKIMVVQSVASAEDASGTVSNLTFTFKASLDGVNWAALTPKATAVLNLNGTNSVVDVEPVATNVVARYVGLASIATDATNLVTVSSLKLTWLDVQQ